MIKGNKGYSLGREISLRDQLSDAITENLPRTDELDSFFETKEYEKMLDECLNVIDDHTKYVLDKATEEITR